MEKKYDTLNNFRVGDTVTLRNPNTGNVDAEISIERIYTMGRKKYYSIKIHSRLYEHDKFLTKDEYTTMSSIVGGITGHYENMNIKPDEE